MLRRLRALAVALALVTGQVVALGVLVPDAAAATGARYFAASLTGPQETPPVATDATATATFVIATNGLSIDYSVTYEGLSGPPTASHIHLGAAGVPGPIILPLSVPTGDGSSGTFAGTLTAADLHVQASVGSFAAALAAIRSGDTYVNIHTAAHPAGEIRGQLAATAHQPSFTITADRPSAVPAGHNWSFNDYFPRAATVTRGTTVLFDILGFHTTTLLPTRVSVRSDLRSSGIAQNDADDATANTNRTTHASYNLRALMPQTPTPGCGTVESPCAFDGSRVVSSGAPLGPSSGPFAVTFTATPGLYFFHCRVHPYMVGAIRVVPSGASHVTTQASADASAKLQAARLVTAGLAAEARATQLAVHRWSRTGVWTVVAGTSGAGGHVSVQEFLPRNLHVKAGDEVVWRPLDVNEPHTITFPTELNSDMVPYCAGDVLATPAHMPPQGPTDFTCPGGAPLYEIELGGGNGVRTIASPSTVADSGIVGRQPTLSVAFGLPRTAILPAWSATFRPSASGPVTFTYLCQIHEGMTATITIP